MLYYIQPTSQDAARLNSIMYNTYVIDSNNNIKFPFQPGTTQYIDLTKSVFCWDTLMDNAITDPSIVAADQTFLSGLKAASKSFTDALTAGWLPAPT